MPDNIPMQKSPALRTILWAGLVCGTMDITAALTVYPYFGAKRIPLLQGIAAGILGEQSFQGGWATAALGLLCHYFIAYSAATVFYFVSRRMAWLIEHAVAAGVLYGITVYYVMGWIIVPLSRARKFGFSYKMMMIGIVIHIICVGLPIALVVRRFSGQNKEIVNE